MSLDRKQLRDDCDPMLECKVGAGDNILYQITIKQNVCLGILKFTFHCWLYFICALFIVNLQQQICEAVSSDNSVSFHGSTNNSSDDGDDDASSDDGDDDASSDDDNSSEDDTTSDDDGSSDDHSPIADCGFVQEKSDELVSPNYGGLANNLF
jgi:hypothetical protein